MRRLRAPFLSVAILASVVAAGSLMRAAVPASTVVVKPSSMNGWALWDDATNTVGGPASLTAGPVGAPLGSGSVRLGPLTTASGTTGMAAIGTGAYNGTPLASITALSYASYQTGPTTAAALQFDIKYRPTDVAYGGRLIFEPYQTFGTVAAGWQTWDPLNGKWWASTTTAAGTNGICGQSSPCTWNAILSAFPNATIAGGLYLKAGSNWTGFDGNADALTIGVNGVDTTFDFEPEVGCTTDCYVNATTGNDTFGGDSASSAKKTIAAALAQVSTGGTVHVAAGTYTGAFTISRSVTLLGAMAGVDPTAGRAGNESAITGLITVSAPLVTIDGFKLSATGTNTSLQSILLKAAGSGAHITNNVISGLSATGTNVTAHAIYLQSGPDDVTVDHNNISAITAAAGSASAVGIGDSASTNPSTNINIHHNAIANISSGSKGAYGVIVNNGANVAPGPTRAYTQVTIADNTITGLAGGTAVGATGGWAHAIGLEGDTPGVIVTRNAISNVVDTVPVPVADASAVFFESNLTFTSAQVTNNTFDLVDTGISASAALLSAGIQGSVTGSCNWWGDASGPNLMTVVSNTIVYSGPGTGAHVVPQVTFGPWKVAPNGPCNGGIPVCAAGSYLASPTDMTCTMATPGHYVPTSGATEQLACPIGTYSAITGAASCAPAAPGTFIDTTGATQATACAPGTYQPNAGSASCVMADAGFYTDLPGAAQQMACPVGTFSNQPGATFCQQATTCGVGQYTAMAATAVSDAICATVTVCLPGYYQSGPAGPFTDASCTITPAGTYTNTTNALAPINCPIGTYQDEAGQTSCKQAPAGHYVATEGAITSTPCMAGTYSASNGASCVPAPAGSFVDVAGSASATLCPIGSYQNLIGQTSCNLAPAGTKSPTIGATHPTPCTGGTYSSTAGSASCTLAAPGSFVPLAQQTHATACPIGTYQPNSGQTSCIQAAVGHYVSTSGSPTETECAAGTYADLQGMSHCNAAPAGFFVPTTGAAAAMACPVGTFSDTPGATSCTTATVCGAGQYVTAAATSTSDTVCAAVTVCQPGSYVSGYNGPNPVCALAPAGTFTNTTNASAPTDCPVGTYQPNTGSTSCLQSPAGSFVPTPGAAAATACAAGTYQDLQAQMSCKSAQPGTYVATSGAVSATMCAVGTYQSLAGQTSCTNAAPGNFVNQVGAAQMTACPLGFYQPSAGSSSCLQSPAGSYVSTTGAVAATQCAAGTYQDLTASISCKPSPAGYYVPTAGAASATICPVGTTSGVGATSCTPIAPPTFSGTPANITTTAATAAGATVTYITPTARDYNNIAVPVTCAPASGATFPVGTTTVTCTATDSYAHSATTTFTVTVSDPTTPGAMSGEGVVKNGDDRYSFNFQVREQASGERARFSLEVKYAKRTVLDSRGRPKQVEVEDGKFKSTGVTFVAFSDDPTVRPGRSNRPQVDSVLFTGVGQWNGRSGYTYEVRAVDQGEPGRHRESVSIVIRDASGAIVAQASGDLVSGNVQSQRIKH